MEEVPRTEVIPLKPGGSACCEMFFLVFPFFDLIFSANTCMITETVERGIESQRKEGCRV